MLQCEYFGVKGGKRPFAAGAKTLDCFSKADIYAMDVSGLARDAATRIDVAARLV